MNGKVFYNHDIMFKEEAFYLMQKLQLDSKPVTKITETEPIDLKNFVKYVREKQRLCWKEIYLKFKVFTYKVDQCKECR